MSEYQYYEFAAIDRPLTHTEMAELRAVSTRAIITPGSFTNHYEWGNLKADPADWMQRYFDAFVYSADWGNCHFSLRLPKTAFDEDELCPFITPTALFVESSDTHWILSWSLEETENHDRFSEDDGSGWMRRLIPLRDEMLRGDLRPLYLGWLAAGDALPDGALEPDVPSGLAELSPAQHALVEFLEIDLDLLEAVSMGSAAFTPKNDEEESRDIATWLNTWQISDMQCVLMNIAQERDQEATRQVKHHYAEWLKAQRPVATSIPRRSVAELRELAISAAIVRREREARVKAKRHAERRQQRTAELRQMMSTSDKYWKMAHEQASRGNASGYEKAVCVLRALAEGYALVASREIFDRELRRFLVCHATRAALLRRLADASLWSE